MSLLRDALTIHVSKDGVNISFGKPKRESKLRELLNDDKEDKEELSLLRKIASQGSVTSHAGGG